MHFSWLTMQQRSCLSTDNKITYRKWKSNTVVLCRAYAVLGKPGTLALRTAQLLLQLLQRGRQAPLTAWGGLFRGPPGVTVRARPPPFRCSHALPVPLPLSPASLCCHPSLVKVPGSQHAAILPQALPSLADYKVERLDVVDCPVQQLDLKFSLFCD